MRNVKEEYKELSKYRIERAEHDLEAAKRNFKEGVFPVEISDMIGNAFEIRNISDYDVKLAN